jgi:LysM repeat protein
VPPLNFALDPATADIFDTDGLAGAFPHGGLSFADAGGFYSGGDAGAFDAGDADDMFPGDAGDVLSRLGSRSLDADLVSLRFPDAGWGLGSITKAVSHAAKSVAKTVAKPVASVARTTAAVAKKAAPVLTLARTVAPLIPGAGSAVGAALSAAEALGQGKSPAGLLKAAALGALPGGPLARSAVEAGLQVVQGKSVMGAVSEQAIAYARSQVPPQARSAFDLAVGTGMAALGKNARLPTNIAGIVGQLTSPALRHLPLTEVARRLGQPLSAVQTAAASLTAATARISKGAPPVLLRPLPQLVRAIGTQPLDDALLRYASAVAPPGGMARRPPAIRRRDAGAPIGVRAFSPARIAPLHPRTWNFVRSVSRHVGQWPAGVQARARMATDAAGLAPGGDTYVVEDGDTLTKIATKLGHGAQWRELRDYNIPPFKMASNGAFTSMNPGDVLRLPPSWVKAPAAAPPVVASPPVAALPPGIGGLIPAGYTPPVPALPGSPPTGVPPVPTLPPAGVQPRRLLDGSALPPGAISGIGTYRVTYEVVDGDYGGKIATKFKIASGRAAELGPPNPGKNISAIYPGDILNIPNSWTKDDPATATPPMVMPPPPMDDGLPPGPAKLPPLPPTIPGTDIPIPPIPGDIIPATYTEPPEGTPPVSPGPPPVVPPDGSRAVQAKALLAAWCASDGAFFTSPPLGMLPLDLTPEWDSRAEQATKAFQGKNGLVPTGTMDDTTYKTLRAWADKRAGTPAAPPAPGGQGTTPTVPGDIIPNIIGGLGGLGIPGIPGVPGTTPTPTPTPGPAPVPGGTATPAKDSGGGGIALILLAAAGVAIAAGGR